MKLSKKLIAAIGMLTLSAVMLVTSSFAWFSMNVNVSATGMTVTATGDQIYLQIVNSAGASTDTTKTQAVGTLTHVPDTSEVVLLPVSVRTGDDEYDNASAPTWVTNTGTSYTDGTANAEYQKLITPTNGEYFLKNTFTISLDPAAGDTTADSTLKITTVDLDIDTATNGGTDSFSKSISVLVVSTINGTVKGSLWKYTETGADTNVYTWGATNKELSAAAFGPDAATVDVYVFFDGDHKTCTLENLAAAKNATYSVTVNFTVA